MSKKYRSGLEQSVAQQIEKVGIAFDYEPCKITYIQPEKKAKYTPDFILANGIVVETKGRFLTKDRQKHLLIKEQYPLLDLRFVFSNCNSKLDKRSNTTYAMWCLKHGFMYANGLIPTKWLFEEPTKERLEVLKQLYEAAN